jgi:hypothetical protein
MPVGVVKSPADEKKWERAKEAAAKEGKGQRWPLVMHIFQNMKKADDGEDHNVKIERALAAQGKKTTIPHEFHEALHSWWQENKAKALSPEQHKMLADIKSVKERRKGMKLIKEEERKAAAQELFKTLTAMRETLIKAMKGKMRDWEPKQYSPEQQAKMQPLLDQGFHPREAAHMSDVQHVKEAHPYTKVTPFSGPMLALAQQVADDHLKEYHDARGALAQPEHNPNIHMQHQAKQLATQHTGDYKKDLDAFKSSDQFKGVDPKEHGKVLAQFKLSWLKDNKDKMLGNLANATEKMAGVAADAQAKREQEKHEIRANIARGGHGIPEGSGSSDDFEAQQDYGDESDLEG